MASRSWSIHSPFVATDQAHAPRQRLAAAAGHAGVDERVEDGPLAHAQSGHHRGAVGREQLLVVAATGTPGDLAAPERLGVGGDGHAALAGVLPEPADAGPMGHLGPVGVEIGGRRRCIEHPDHQDLLPIGADIGRPLEPSVGQPPGEPAADLGHRPDSWRVVMLTRLQTYDDAVKRVAPFPFLLRFDRGWRGRSSEERAGLGTSRQQIAQLTVVGTASRRSCHGLASAMAAA